MPARDLPSPASTQADAAPTSAGRDFIRTMIDGDLATGKHGGRVKTRFPPEPNGYLHIGHAKSICLNFGIAAEYGGATCNLRFDDTNPLTEDMEYVDSIQHDVRWLGFDWDDRLFFASDSFERLYEKAEELVQKGLAYVDGQSEKEIRDGRGTVTTPGVESPDRNRTVAENLDLLRRMRAGEFGDGTYVLRAKIDMAHANMKMRDPLLYRIRHADHYRTAGEWCIYPMYDFTHCLSDAFEGITHSLCTLEFENNREIYDWVIDNVETEYRPEQTEFARLNLTFTVLSKRKLLELVQEGLVDGWDDPRMPTLSGLRRRGYTPDAIRVFCDRIGVSKSNSVVDVAQLEHAIRDDLNPLAPRVMAVLRPLKVVIENYPEGETEELEAPYWPHDIPKEASRPVPFGREILIERDDFMENPPKRFHRLAPGREVRLRYGYFVRCVDVIKDEAGEVVELRCTYDPATRGGSAPDGRKVRGTIHWVSAVHSLSAEMRLYDRLFSDPNPDRGKGGPDFRTFLNPDSLTVLTGCRIEPSLATAAPGARFQFERLGYFFLDPGATEAAGHQVFNRVVTLRDSWAKISEGALPRAASKRGTGRPRPVEETAVETARSAVEADPLAGLAPDRRPVAAGYHDRLGVEVADARLLAPDAAVSTLFERTAAIHGDPRRAANWVINMVLPALEGRPPSSLPFGADELAELLDLVADGTVSATAAKEVFEALLDSGGSPREIVEEAGLHQLSDTAALEAIVDEVLSSHPDEVAAFRGGKKTLLGFFVGRVMAQTERRADPRRVGELLEQRLGSS